MKVKKIRIKDKWIPAIPDSLNLPCGICGHTPYIDYGVDDDLWNKIAPKDMARGVICLHCFDKLCKLKGIDITKHIKDIYYCGDEKTLQLSIDTEYDWSEFDWKKIRRN